MGCSLRSPRSMVSMLSMFFAPGMGSNSVPLIQLRIVLLAPIPRASVSTASAQNPVRGATGAMRTVCLPAFDSSRLPLVPCRDNTAQSTLKHERDQIIWCIAPQYLGDVDHKSTLPRADVSI